MRKEEIRGLVVYTILIVVALIVGFTAIRPSLESFGPNKMSPFGFIIVVLIVAYLFNAIGLEVLHVLGAIFGGYKVTSFNVFGICLYQTPEKWKLGFRDFNGINGETKIAPNKEKKNVNLLVWFPLFGYAVELASCIVIAMLVKNQTFKTEWLRPAALLFVLISSMLAFYNFIPFKLDSMTDGYRLRLFLKPVNVEAYNKMLVIQEDQRLGKTVENVPVFEEITEYTAEFNMIAMYNRLDEEKYDEALVIIDQLLENKKVLNINDQHRLVAQKLYLAILTQPLEEAKKLYDEICPIEIRRFIANDISMPSIRAYVLIAGMIEESEGEVNFAKSKVEKAKKRSLASEVKTEEVLLEKALKYVYENHPKWNKEKADE